MPRGKDQLWITPAIVGLLFAGHSLIASPAPNPASTGTAVAARLHAVKLINYYPSSRPWNEMWTDWDPVSLNEDFHTIGDLNANTVRLILQPKVFGYPTPSPLMVQRLRIAVALASAAGLNVQLTLFDLWTQYGDLSGSENWAREVLAGFRNDARIQSIELQNEIDDADPLAMVWARQMLPYVRDTGGDVPITISSRATLADLDGLRQALGVFTPDFYSFHYYGDLNDAFTTLKRARDIVAPLPVFIGETGQPSSDQSPGGPPDPKGEAEQMRFIAAVENATQALALPAAAPWIFQDFAPRTLPQGSSLGEYHFGLLRLDGSPKPVAIWLQSYFRFRS